MKRVSFLTLALASSFAGACGGSSPAVTAASATSTAARVGALGGSCRATSAATPIGETRVGSTIALAKIGAQRVALVADEDAKAVLTIDLDTRAELATTGVGGVPSQIAIGKDGRVFVALRDRSELVVLRAERAGRPLEGVCAVATPSEPRAVALSPDEKTLLVTAGWGQKLAAFEAATLALRFEAKVPREPRAVVVSDDGRTAFVSHAVGSVLTAVDLVESKHAVRTLPVRGHVTNDRLVLEQQQRILRAGTLVGAAQEEALQRALEGRPTCQGFALAKSTAVGGRIFAPQVVVEPGQPERRTNGYGDQGSIPETPSVAVIDERAGEPFASSLLSSRRFTWSGIVKDQRSGVAPDCLLPRSAAIDPASKTLLVTCFGADMVVAYDATSGAPASTAGRHWLVGAGPSGIAIDADKHRGVVFSQFDRTLSTFDIGDGTLVDDKGRALPVEKTALASLPAAVPTAVATGRMLFHAAGDPRISSDGRACASCHPDGRDDGITWSTPEGPRRSILLAGRVGATAPYSWNGDETTLPGHLTVTFDRLHGQGIKSHEIDALVSYISSLPAPPPRAIEDRAKVARGRDIFVSSEAGCSSCHAGSAFTDGRNHDVGSKHRGDRTASFNTPSLRFVGGTGPYFHDGRYATLDDLLRKSDGAMGKTKHLSNADFDALKTYLETL